MKRTKILSLAAAAIALTFAACTKEAATPDGGPSFSGDTAYAKVAISMPTRAEAGWDTFDPGTYAEAHIHNLAILLYDDAKNLVGSGTSSDFTTAEDGRTDNGGISDTHTGTIVKIMLEPGTAQPTQLFAFVNTNVTYNTVDEAREALTGEIGSTDKGFVMTNAGYKGTAWTDAVTISTANLFNTIAEAEAATPVVINVERLAAKATVKLSDAVKTGENSEALRTADYTFVDVNNKEYEIVFEAKKWSVTGLADEMYVLKKEFTESESWMNDANRSYWATGKYYDYSYTQFVNDGLLTYLKASEFIQNDGAEMRNFTDATDPRYVTEHTFGPKAYEGYVEEESEGAIAANMTATSAIIAGKYTVKGVSEGADATKFAGTNEGDTDFYIAMKGADNGKNSFWIYSKEDLIKKLLALDGYTETNLSTTTGTTTAIDKYTDYFDVDKDDDDKYHVIAAKDAETVYVVADNAYTELNFDDLDATSAAKHYYNGWAYFFAPIKHKYVEATPNAVGAYGVVRNHSYELTINSINGLGAPLDEGKIGSDPENPTEEDPNPDEPIEPNPDDLKDAYINATLNVLSWHVVSQGVDL